MRKFIAFIVCTASLATSASAGYRDSVDADGCWDATRDNGDGCLSMYSGSSLEMNNQCRERVFVRYCLMDFQENMFRTKREAVCRETSIRGNDSRTVGTPNEFTGARAVEYVGSTNSGADLRCAERYGMSSLRSLRNDVY